MRNIAFTTKCNFVIFPIPENVRGFVISITKEGECYSLQDPADYQIQTLMASVELSVKFRSVEQEKTQLDPIGPHSY